MAAARAGVDMNGARCSAPRAEPGRGERHTTKLAKELCGVAAAACRGLARAPTRLAVSGGCFR